MTTQTTRWRGPVLGLALVTACVSIAPAHATTQQASREESVGVATGFAVGAAAGGPIGAILGAAAGAVLGDRYHKQSVARANLAKDLGESELERKKLHTQLVQTQEQGEQLGRALDRTRDIELSVNFRTGDASVSEEAAKRLKKLGSLAASIPDAKLRVSGYADPRGSEELNAALSKQRAEAVAEVLASAGVDGTRFIIESHGESQSTTPEGDLDGYAFERRVTVRLEREGGEVVALRQ